MDEETACAILGLNSCEITFQELKRAYRKVLKLHPDKNENNNSDDFINFMEAYNFMLKLLSPTAVVEIPKEYNVEVKTTLEQLYHGSPITIPIQVKKLCPSCNGFGGQVTICSKNCRRLQHLPPAHGYNQFNSSNEQTFYIDHDCKLCHGKGVYVNDLHKCRDCNGCGFHSKTLSYIFNVPKGAEDKDTRTEKIADENDIYLVTFCIQEIEHPRFKRDGCNLHYSEITISLDEALNDSPYTFKIEHLTGQMLTLICEEHPRPSATFVLTNAGMPKDRHGLVFGNLYFKFRIIFPVALSHPPKQQTLPLGHYIIKSTRTKSNDIAPRCAQQ